TAQPDPLSLPDALPISSPAQAIITARGRRDLIWVATPPSRESTKSCLPEDSDGVAGPAKRVADVCRPEDFRHIGGRRLDSGDGAHGSDRRKRQLLRHGVWRDVVFDGGPVFRDSGDPAARRRI